MVLVPVALVEIVAPKAVEVVTLAGAVGPMGV